MKLIQGVPYGLLDARYLKLDCSNDPLTGQLSHVLASGDLSAYTISYSYTTSHSTGVINANGIDMSAYMTGSLSGDADLRINGISSTVSTDTLSAFSGTSSATSVAMIFTSTGYEDVPAGCSCYAYGVYGSASGNMGTVGAVTSHIGGYYDASGSAIINYGAIFSATGATTNYGFVNSFGDCILGKDNAKAYIGTGNDMYLIHDGTNSSLINTNGDLIINNSQTTVSTLGKIRESASTTLINTTGTYYTQKNDYAISAGSSTNASTLYGSYEAVSLTTSTQNILGFPSYYTKYFNITMTGAGGSTWGSPAYGLVYDVNISGTFAGQYYYYLGAILQDIDITGVTIASLAASEYTIDIVGSSNISAFSAVKYTANINSSIAGTVYGVYTQLSGSSGGYSTGSTYANYCYVNGATAGTINFTRGQCNGYYFSSYGSSDLNTFAFRVASMTSSGMDDYAFFTDFGDSVIKELYIGKPYNMTGATGGDQKANLVSNYDFTTDTVWTKGTGWTISGGNAVKAAGVASDIEQSIAIYAGRCYFVQLAFGTYTAGTLTVELGGVSTLVLNPATSKMWYGFVQPTTTGNLKLKANAAGAYQINYCFVREIGESAIYMGTSKLTMWDTNTFLQSPAADYINSSRHFSIASDSYKYYMGAGNDMTMWYDGTYGQINTSDVAASDLRVTCGANKTIELQNVVYDDLQFPVSGAKVPAANYPDWETFTANTNEYSFDVDDYIDASANELPHWWKQGTAGDAHLHITTKAANNTGASRYAKFSLVFAYADSTEAWVEQAALTAELTITNGTAALTSFYLDMGDLTFTNYLIGAQVKVRIKRIAATGGTEYAGNIFITQCGVHLQKDTLGSRQEAIK